MGTLLIVLAQALDLGIAANAADDAAVAGVERVGVELPAIGDLEWSPQAHPAEERIGVEAFAVWTRFDTGLRIEDAWGFGGDVKVGLDWGTSSSLGMRLGYAGWETENDDQQTRTGHTKIRQYRIGVGGDFSSRYLEFSIYGNSGLYHFHTRQVDNDTKMFFELQGSIGVKPLPFLKLGITGMVTWTSSDFNRGSSHLFTQHSIGPMIEVRLLF